MSVPRYSTRHQLFKSIFENDTNTIPYKDIYSKVNITIIIASLSSNFICLQKNKTQLQMHGAEKLITLFDSQKMKEDVFLSLQLRPTK